MPKGTRVSRCVDKVKRSKDEGAAIAICQSSTNQGYASGKKLKEAIASKVVKPGPGKPAKKLKDSQDDCWEKEEKREGYRTPKADDTRGYDSPTDDNASDDFKHGRWMKEDPPKKYKKKLKESLRSLVERQAPKRVRGAEGGDYVTKGKTGTSTTIGGGRLNLTGVKSKQAELLKKHTSGPKGRLPEAQSFSQTQMDAQKKALKPLNPKPRRAKKLSLTAGGNKTTGANAAGDEGVPVGNDANKKSQELQQQGDQDHAMYEKDIKTMDKQWNKERIDEVLPAIAAALRTAATTFGRGATKAAETLTKKAVEAGGRAAKGAAKKGAKKAVKRTLSTAKERLSPEDETMEDNTRYANAYVRKLMEATGGPNTAPVSDEDRKATARFAAYGRGGPHDTSKSNEPKRSPSGSKRSKKTKAADDAAGVVVSHTEYHRIGRILYEVAGRKLSPVQKKYKGTSASEVASSKTVDTEVQADVSDEAARTQAKVPGANPDAGHLLAQKKARDAGKRPTGRGHGTSKSGLGATTPRKT